ncbi:hypothetical protein HAX54_030455, partial [Datura stramonium]|nr:hypothetical protein [Datura stramonium]
VPMLATGVGIAGTRARIAYLSNRTRENPVAVIPRCSPGYVISSPIKSIIIISSENFFKRYNSLMYFKIISISWK